MPASTFQSPSVSNIPIQEVLDQLRIGKTLEDIIGPNYQAYRAQHINELGLPKIAGGMTIGWELEFYSSLSYNAILDRLGHAGLAVRRTELSTHNSAWDISGDGSIRPDLLAKEVEQRPAVRMHAHELKSPILTADQVYYQTISACNVLNDQVNGMAIGQVNPSCGLHIHIGRNNLTDAQKANIVTAFQICWPKFADITPDHRLENNRYCRPLATSDTYASLMAERSKYKALNISTHHPTFEYRFPSATRNWYIIYCTILALTKVHEFGSTTTRINNQSFYDIVNVPILWNFFSRRKQWLESKALIDAKKKSNIFEIKIASSNATAPSMNNAGWAENHEESIWDEPSIIPAGLQFPRAADQETYNRYRERQQREALLGRTFRRSSDDYTSY